MTRERAFQIENEVIYNHLEKFKGYLASECDNSDLAFDLGRVFGAMHKTLLEELCKEITEEVEND